MNELLDDDDRPSPRGDRELTLSTGAILGIFFGLVLLCGVCFGVGYNVGHKSMPTPLALNDAPSDNLTADATAAKPPAGSPVDVSSSAAPVIAAPTPAPRPAPVRKPAPITPAPTATPEEADETPAPTRSSASPTPAPVVRVPPSALMPSSTPPAGSASLMVQVAAVSHQEDADLLVGALRGRGYTVSARPSGADNFIHVQVGPFADKKQAEAMRQRLIADGYNAIVK